MKKISITSRVSNFQGYMNSHGNRLQNSYGKTQGKTKTKQGNVLSRLLRAVVLGFFHRLSDELVLNRRTLAATDLCETCNIIFIKKYN